MKITGRSVVVVMEATFLILVLVVSGIPALPASPLRQSVNCGGSVYMHYGHVQYFSSPGFPGAYPNGLHCLWMVMSPAYTALRLHCQYFDTAPSENCNVDTFYFSPSGYAHMQDAVTYCGLGTLDVTTYANYFAARFLSQNDHVNTHSGFWCMLQVVPQNGGSEVSTPNPLPQVTNPPTTTGQPGTTSEPGATAEPGTSSEPETTSEPGATVEPETTSAPGTTAEPGTTSAPGTTSEPGTTAVPPPIGDCQCGLKGGSRIVGGQETDVNEWPWQAGLRQINGNEIFCGASLINNQWLVTAAHCLEQFEAHDLIVSLGDHEQTSNSDSIFTDHITVAEVIKHASYNSITVDNDIALIRLSTPVIYNEGIRPICLPFGHTSEELSGQQGTVTGWGTLQFQGDTSSVLMEAELPILTTSECQGYNAVTDLITHNMICTYEAGKDACQGDSGGPLQWEHQNRQYLVGLVSWGYGCGDVDSPGVYTKVTNYLQWIQDRVPGLCSPPTS